MNLSIQQAVERYMYLRDKYPQYKLSLGIEHSDVIDWYVDITPRANHPKAREYGEVWTASGHTIDQALNKALDNMEKELTE